MGQGGFHVNTTASVRTSTTHSGPSVCTWETPSADHRERDDQMQSFLRRKSLVPVIV